MCVIAIFDIYATSGANSVFPLIDPSVSFSSQGKLLISQKVCHALLLVIDCDSSDDGFAGFGSVTSHYGFRPGGERPTPLGPVTGESGTGSAVDLHPLSEPQAGLWEK